MPNRRTDPLDDTLLELRDALDKPDVDALAAIRNRVLADAEAAESSPPVPSRRFALRRVPASVYAGAAVLMAVCLAAVLVQFAPSEQTGTTDGVSLPVPSIELASAEHVLQQAARSLESIEMISVQQGPFRLVEEHAWVQQGMEYGSPYEAGPDAPRNGYTYLLETRSQLWIPADETQEWLERRSTGQSRWLGGTTPESESALYIDETRNGEWRARCGRFFDDNRDSINCVPDDWDDPNFYRSLPADPEGLLRWLRDYTAPRGSTPEAMFHIAIEILRAGMMPPDVKAQWYRAIAGIDGVETVEQTTLDGRSGTALGLSGVHERRDLIIDPGTGEFIGERRVAGAAPEDPWIAPGTVLGTSSITVRPVDELGSE
ncbi:CU044_5270 family protein [Rhodococcus erythropolis]|uniref:CU044_5270 family protein n=1 Tax=Rhodococcus erythropolis TaxID=1833 RepID=UPI0002E6216B|nr:CU044_5270 family protein [Rhodococcus erythropolis]